MDGIRNFLHKEPNYHSSAAVGWIVFQLSLGKGCPVDTDSNKQDAGLLLDILCYRFKHCSGRNFKITTDN
jgi:hypothetical protein